MAEYYCRLAGHFRLVFPVSGQKLRPLLAAGFTGVGQLILNFSRRWDYFIKAFAGVLSWFGIDMPKSFTDFWKNLITGLVDGDR